MAVKAECHLKRWVRELRQTAQSETGELKTNVKEKVVKCAIKVCERRLRDLDQMIDDPSAYEELVSAAEWKILGADELNEKTLAKKDHEKYLKEHNMPLPPKSKAKKKRKRKIKTPSEGNRDAAQEEEEDDEEDLEDDDEEDAVDKLIAKKYPDFKTVLDIIERLRKTFP